jgi:hypothetical protein
MLQADNQAQKHDGSQVLVAQPVILVPQNIEIRRITVEASLGKQFGRPYPDKKSPHKEGLMEWLRCRP